MTHDVEPERLSHPHRVGGRRAVGFFLATALALVSWLALAGSPAAVPHASPPIVFMTDFGTNNDAVPICKGVIYAIDPDVRIVDLTHQVRPYSIIDGARFLLGTSPYYPDGTVFLTVIDPGVGSSRKAMVVKTRRGQYFVLPDNGLITLVQNRDGIEAAREIANPAWMIGGGVSSTFHGRDIFSPTAAHLARGDEWTQVGPEIPVESLVRLDIPASRLDGQGMHGEILGLDDPYGSLISNIGSEDFEKLGYSLRDRVHVTVGRRELTVPYVRTFSDVSVGAPLLYINSRGQVGLAINQGDFSKAYGIKPPAPIFIRHKNAGGT